VYVADWHRMIPSLKVYEVHYPPSTNILSRFLIAERTGNWELHLTSIQEMLPYFVAAGHYFYAKSAYVY
jgi:hypothetical protein